MQGVNFIITKPGSTNIMPTQSGTIRISFNSKEDKDNGFFELIQTSGSGFMGTGKNEFLISEEQGRLLRDKNINFTEIQS
jgi:hypothetical protein